MYKYLTILFPVLLLQTLAAELVSGPMLAGLEMREARIWVQTEQASIVRIAYAEAATPAQRSWSIPVETDPALANTATINLSGIEAGKTYNYQIEVNGERLPASYSFTSPAFYQGRTPPPDFTIAVGGAHYRLDLLLKQFVAKIILEHPDRNPDLSLDQLLVALAAEDAVDGKGRITRDGLGQFLVRYADAEHRRVATDGQPPPGLIVNPLLFGTPAACWLECLHVQPCPHPLLAFHRLAEQRADRIVRLTAAATGGGREKPDHGQADQNRKSGPDELVVNQLVEF